MALQRVCTVSLGLIVKSWHCCRTFLKIMVGLALGRNLSERKLFVFIFDVGRSNLAAWVAIGQSCFC